MKQVTLRGLAVLLVAGLGSSLLVPRAEAQFCPQPDGLNGPCCTGVNANLPIFPSFELASQSICWDNCNPTEQLQHIVNYGPPQRQACGQYTALFTLLDPTVPGLTLLHGDLNLDYTRTWMETDIAGVDHQVWRFMVKGDLVRPPSAPLICPVPSCLYGPDLWTTVFFYGYVDYVENCFSGDWDSVLVLFHNCDKYIHDPFLSSTPGSFHPNRRYGIVAPDTPLNPFMPFPLPPPGGPLVAEAVRDANFAPTIGLCTTEEFITQGVHQPLIRGCACPLGFNPQQESANRFRGTGSCAPLPSTFSALNTRPAGAPWFELVKTSIGAWTTPVTYPGEEGAFVDEGVFAYVDACYPLFFPGENPTSLDVFYGATTIDGWPTFAVFDPDFPTPEPTQNFIDLASNYWFPLPGQAPFPIVGNVFPTEHLIYTNVP